MPVFMSKEELVKQWRYNLTNHTPNAEGIDNIEKCRSAAKLFAEVLIDNCPTSRELSLALTSVEEALFHGNSAIARHKTDDAEKHKAAIDELHNQEQDKTDTPA